MYVCKQCLEKSVLGWMSFFRQNLSRFIILHLKTKRFVRYYFVSDLLSKLVLRGFLIRSVGL